MAYEIVIAGIVDEGFTSAEVNDAAGTYVGRVFELEKGWYVEVPNLDVLRDQEVVEALLQARDALLPYPNRKGGEPSPDTTRAGFSLWLMERDGK